MKKNNLYILNLLLKYITYYRTKYKLNNIFKNLKYDIKIFDNETLNYLNTLKKNGFLIIEDFFNKNICESIISDINGFIKKNPQQILRDNKDSDHRIFGAEKISRDIFEFYNNKLILLIAENYLNSKVHKLMTMANKVVFKKNNFGSGGGWHRDGLDSQFKSILYLVDVNENNGPFQLVKDSHKLKNIFFDNLTMNQEIFNTRITDEKVNKILKKNNLITITAKAGTLLIVDTSTIHRGKPLIKGTRYALTNYFYPWHSDINYNNSFKLINLK